MKIRINDKTYFFFNRFVVRRTLDSIASSFTFLANFNPDNENHKELFKPLSYPKIEVFNDDDDLLLTGNIVNHDFNSGGIPKLVKISGYSSGGILEDCNVPYSAYPLESLNVSLKEITERLLKIFNLDLIIASNVSNDANLIYEKSVVSPTTSIKDYLAAMAAQRNIVLSHNNKGEIIYFRPDITATPKILFNKENTIDMRFLVRGQNIHDEITVIRQPSVDNDDLTPVDTVKNPLLDITRPIVRTLKNGTDTDTSKAANNFLASELQNMPLTIKTPRNEKLEPGDIIEVQNDEVYLYDRTRFIIKTITLSQTEASDTTDIIAVLPEAYTGEKPKQFL